MTSLEEFKEILDELQVEVPEDSLEVFRDMVDAQTDTILESWIQEKMKSYEE